MPNARLASIAILLMALLPPTVFSQPACDGQFVSEVNGTLQVSRTGGDDTANIQCALDAAVAANIPEVALQAGSFSIGQLEVVNFAGQLKGVSKANTQVVLREGAINCAADQGNGRIPSAIRFIGGSPRLRTMTLQAGDACMTPGRFYIAVTFTGRNQFSDCGNDVIFAEVDRVDLLVPERIEQGISGIRVAPERLGGDDCAHTMSGTFKLNRSSLDGFDYPLLVQLIAQSPVEVRFSEFSQYFVGIQLFNGIQDTSIIANTFHQVSDFFDSVTSIRIELEDIPTRPPNAVRVQNNEFNMTNRGWAIEDDFDGEEDQTLVITGNHFNLLGNSSTNPHGAARLDAINGGVFNGNSVSNNGGFIVLQIETEGWAALRNQMQGQAVFLGVTSSNNVIGAGQGAQIIDQGVGNIVP